MATPHIQLPKALFTINILNFSKGSRESRFQKHWEHLTPKPQMLVRWRDPLTRLWRGPDPLIQLGRGFGCVFPIGELTPIWIPARNIRPMPDASNNPPRERFAPEGDSLVFPLPEMDGDPEAGDDADTTLRCEPNKKCPAQ